MGRRRKQKLPSEPVEALIENLSHEGRGIARVEGKTVFVDGALTGETVEFKYTRQKSRHAEGQAISVKNPADTRAEPKCPHYEICGGCRLQHMKSDEQIRFKQSVMLEQMTHIGHVEAQNITPSIVTSPWGYRRKARLGVKYVHKKGRVLVGFREKNAPFVADMDECHVLHERVGTLITPLSDMIDGLSIRSHLPQIEVAMGDEQLVLLFRVLEPPTEEDKAQLVTFSETHDLLIYLQPGGYDTVEPLTEAADLSYTLKDDDLTIHFGVSDFTQVNLEMNRKMVAQAMQWLDLHAEDCLLDLFCGVGNFTLPAAKRANTVVGVEGDASLVEKAERNATLNGSKAVFYKADLTKEFLGQAWMQLTYNKMLIDPPRSGALEVIQEMAKFNIPHIVYVSCNPATLARDADELVNKQGYTLVNLCAMDMFPHTAHVESMALFIKAG
ncbi:MAG: 23S rRNA (uracil(1939)-C(5))-methyltransferase RlmD [Methylococcales bacterium]|jgi:23S rRNA (uracil1939-C5)-methyltransferase|nr:23S rRNA (uracil(1939)-C(5))-methyltransferase RlmD [Methylococcales bacterium]